MLIGVLSSFEFKGQLVDDINHSALATTSKAITPVLLPIGVTQDNWQATVGLVSGIMAKEVVVGTLNSLYTTEAIQRSVFDPQAYNLADELKEALTETMAGLTAAFRIDALAHPIDASKGDGEMASGSMGVMATKFGSGFAAYSYLIFALLYVPCVSVMGAIAREAGKKWMIFSFFWGLNIAYTIATLFYQTVTFNEHPAFSAVCLISVLLLNGIILLTLRKAGNRVQAIPVRPGEEKRGCRGCHGNCDKQKGYAQ